MWELELNLDPLQEQYSQPTLCPLILQSYSISLAFCLLKMHSNLYIKFYK